MVLFTKKPSRGDVERWGIHAKVDVVNKELVMKYACDLSVKILNDFAVFNF